MLVTVIGLGNMGLPMALNLVRAGHQVRGYDRAAAAVQGLVAGGGLAATSVQAAVAGAETVLTMLPAGAQVREVLGQSWPVAALGALFIDSSTIDVQTARDMAAEGSARGLAVLDAPVSGGASAAAAGLLTFMVGGEPAVLERARPVLSAMGRNIVHAGGAGAGQAAKICNNLLLAITMLGVGEAFALAGKLGLSAQALFDVSSTSSGQCWALTNYCPVPGPVPASPANHGYKAGFATNLMLKDVSLAVDSITTTGCSSVLARAARDAYAQLSELGLGDQDFSVAARALLDGQIGHGAGPHWVRAEPLSPAVRQVGWTRPV